MVIWSAKSGDLMTNYSPICVWGRLPSDLTSSAKWRPRAEGPSLCPISQGLLMTHKKPGYEYRFIPYLLVQKIALKSHPHTCRLTPCFRCHYALFGDSSQVRAWCYNIAQRAVGFYDVIMRSVTSSMHSHDKTNERTLGNRCSNNALEHGQSNYWK